MTRKPFHPLEPPLHGDPTPEQIYVEVGRALSSWESLEDVLADLFAIFTGSKDIRGPSPAKRAYGTIVGFRGRQDMLKAAADSFLSQPDEDKLLSEIKSFLIECGEFSMRRNEIAHGQAKTISINIAGIAGFSDPTWYLTPPLYASGKHAAMPIIVNDKNDRSVILKSIKEAAKEIRIKGFGKYKYSSKEIRYYNDQFSILCNRAEQIIDRFPDVTRSLLETPEPRSLD